MDQGLSVDDVIDIAKAIPWTDYGYRVPKVELLERASDSASDEPEAVGVMWQPGELMDTGDTTPAKAAAVCLHCHQQPATKAEDDKGFTLCDGCWHASQTDAPPISPLQAEDMAREIDMLQAINTKRARARKVLEEAVVQMCGGNFRNPFSREAAEEATFDELYGRFHAELLRLEQGNDDAVDARNILSWVGYHHEPGGLESALKGALADSRTPARWRHHRRAERARLLGQATLHEAAAHDHAAAGDGPKMARALQQAAELELQAQTQFSDLEDD